MNTKIKKLKETIGRLEKDISGLNRDQGYYRGKYEEIEKERKEMRSMNENNYEEVMWLRKLVELITVDEKKFAKLDEMQKQREMARSRKLRLENDF